MRSYELVDRFDLHAGTNRAKPHSQGLRFVSAGVGVVLPVEVRKFDAVAVDDAEPFESQADESFCRKAADAETGNRYLRAAYGVLVFEGNVRIVAGMEIIRLHRKVCRVSSTRDTG